MGRKIGTLIFSFIFVTTAFASGDSTFRLTLQKVIPGDYTNFYTDNLGDIFLVSNTNQIKKLNADLDSVGVFNDVRRYGTIYSLDVSNPLKMIVYYKDFTTILVLDRFLNTRNTIDLRKYDILQARAVALSYDNNYWIFDELDNKIKKIDDNGNVLLQSSDFRILFQEQYAPSYMIDSNGLLYLYDEKKGWLVFDYYGTYKQAIGATNRRDIQIAGNQLISRDSARFYYYNPKTFNEIKITAPQIAFPETIKVQQTLNKIFVLQKDGLSVYTINK